MRGSALAACSVLFATAATAASAVVGDGARIAGAVRVGVYLDSDEATAREMAAGADDAVHELGRARVEVVTRRAAPRWGGNAGDVAELIYAERATALVAPNDPREAHAAAMVATRAKVATLVLSSDPRLTRNGVAWIGRAVPDDGELATLLLSEAPIGPGATVALLIEDGGSGEATRAAVVEAAAVLQVAIGPIIVTLGDGAVDRPALAAAFEQAAALLLFAGPRADREAAAATAPGRSAASGGSELPFFTRALVTKGRAGATRGEVARVRFAAAGTVASEGAGPISLVRAGARAAVVELAHERIGKEEGAVSRTSVRAAVWEWTDGMAPRLLRAAGPAPAGSVAATRNDAKQGESP